MQETLEGLRPHAACRQFLLAGVDAGLTVLDVGCGSGALMKEISHRGATPLGVEINRQLVEAACAEGLDVLFGRAESLPIADQSVDAIVCSVVLPYTDERQAIAEWYRVLRPGGVACASSHGYGYGLRFLLRGTGLKRRAYGLRMLVNSIVYQLMGRRLPGFLGDTCCHGSRSLRANYRAAGLNFCGEQAVDTFLGLPVFLCHRIAKPGGRTDRLDAPAFERAKRRLRATRLTTPLPQASRDRSRESTSTPPANSQQLAT